MKCNDAHSPSPPPPPSPLRKVKTPMSKADARQLVVGDKIDYRNGDGRFVMGTVMEIKGTKLGIQYGVWNQKQFQLKSTKMNISWCDISKKNHRHRLAPLGAISKR